VAKTCVVELLCSDTSWAGIGSGRGKDGASRVERVERQLIVCDWTATRRVQV